MSTSFSVVERIAAAPERVLAALTDPEFYPLLGELPAISSPEVLRCEHREGRVELRVRYRFAADLPGPARRVLDPSRLTWVDDTVVDIAGRRARFVIQPEHYGDRLSCRGHWELADAGGGATNQTISGEVSVRWPVVGGAAERGIVRGLEENMEREARLLERWLAAPGR